jgi:hypothetical protein
MTDFLTADDLQASADELLEADKTELARWKSVADTRYRIILALTDIIHQIMCDTENGQICMNPALRQKIVRTVFENDPFAKMARDR